MPSDLQLGNSVLLFSGEHSPGVMSDHSLNIFSPIQAAGNDHKSKKCHWRWAQVHLSYTGGGLSQPQRSGYNEIKVLIYHKS